MSDDTGRYEKLSDKIYAEFFAKAGAHAHRCRDCGNIWAHSNDVPNTSREEFESAHDCPVCGSKEYWKDYSLDSIRTVLEWVRQKFGRVL